jgi:isopentenyldiphosphate isomerase
MSYGPNDNEISTIYRGRVDPQSVDFDRVEIDEVDYLRRQQILEMIDARKGNFCGWFIQMIRWSQGEDSELQILKTHSMDHLFQG